MYVHVSQEILYSESISNLTTLLLRYILSYAGLVALLVDHTARLEILKQLLHTWCSPTLYWIPSGLSFEARSHDTVVGTVQYDAALSTNYTFKKSVHTKSLNNR